MISIKELLEFQEEFDKKHSGNFNWNEKVTEENVEILQYLLISLVGEFGEASNLVKKVLRGDKKLLEVKDELSEEIIDVLIYTLKLIYQLDIDIEKVYYEKMKKNEKRFKKFEKESV